MLQIAPPLIMITWELDAVVRDEPILNTKRALGSPAAFKVRVPVNPTELE
jgi:hypothetical protein